MADRNVVLLVAVSARALAQSTRRAGREAVAIDAFGDEDARLACRELVVASGAQDGFAHFDLEPLASRLVRTHNPMGIVFGSGFEDCPDQLTRLARHAPLLGASPDAVAMAKDPIRFSTLCAEAGLRHPEISLTTPLSSEEWLIKQAGGSGGSHIQSAVTQKARSTVDYWQRRIHGGSVSLLFSCNGGTFTPLGWSEQWTSPSLAMPYRYGGAAGPVICRNEQAAHDGLSRLTGKLRLNGVASADFIDDGENLWLLEVNPRPGATLDVFDDPLDPVMKRHLCAYETPAAPPRARKGVKASAVVYAVDDALISKQAWPEWISDRPAAGTIIPEGSPVCTVHAKGETLSVAKSLLFARVQNALELTRKGAR